MRNFLRLLKFESRRNLKKRVIYVMSIFLVISCILAYVGFKVYKDKIKTQSSFIINEESKLAFYYNLTRHGVFGVKQNGLPAPLFSIFHNSIPFIDLQAFLDDSFRFEINKPLKGANVYAQPYGKNSLDFSWFYFVFFSASSFLFGFFALRNKKFNKMMLNYTGQKTLFSSIILCRFLFMLAFLIITYLVVIAQFSINGISLTGSEIANLGIFFLMVFAVNTGFLILGSAFGTIKNVYTGAGLTILSWFVLIFLIPEIAGTALSKYTDTLFESIYTHELKKLEIFSKAEKAMYEEASKYETPGEIKNVYQRMIKNYLDTDFKKILKLEKKMLRDTIKAADIVHLCGLFIPTTFYKTVGNEISGSAYNGHIDFYRANIENYKNFVRYCLENRTKRIRPKDFPFIKNKEDYVFHMQSSLPKYFGVGLLLCFFYALAALFFSYHMFKKMLFPAPVKAEQFDRLNTGFYPGKHYLIDIEQQEAADQFYNVFSGRGQKFTGKISIEKKNIGAKKQNFFYLPNINDIPADIKAGALLDLTAGAFNAPKDEIDKLIETWGKKLKKPYGNLKPLEKVKFLFDLSKFKKTKIYLLEETFSGVRGFVPEKILNELKNDDTFIVEFLLLPPVKHKYYDHFTRIVLHEAEGKYKEDRVTGQ